MVLRRAGRGHHRGARAPARADRDQPRLGAALSRRGARAAARRRELAVRYMLTGSVHRSGEKVACRPSSATARAARRSGPTASPAPPPTFRAAGRALGPGGGDDRAAGGGVGLRRSSASIPTASTPTNACCAGSTCSTATRISVAQGTALFERAIALDPRYARPMRWPDLPGERFTRAARPIRGRPSRGRAAQSARAHVRSLRSPGVDPVRPYPVVAVPRLRSRHRAVRPALAANPSAAIAWVRSSATFSYIGETLRRAGASRSGYASRRTTRTFLQLRPGRARLLRPGDYGEAAAWCRRAMTSTRAPSATCGSWGEPGRRREFREAHEVGRACCGSNPPSAPPSSRRDMPPGCREARLFGEHLVLAGLPE